MKGALFQSRHVVSALKTLDIELEALATLRTALASSSLRDSVEQAIQLLASTPGRVIVTGMGKSGHIARKIAATMRSTGTSAIFLHPGEASHGDLGVISKQDVVLAITWSGETAELSDILHYCNHYGVKLIVATSYPDSTAGREADICLAMPPVREACPNELAPTSSTTLQLVLGDALAVALTEARGFTPSDFRAFHPGGKLGAQLTTVGQIMGVGEAIPRVGRDASLTSATLEMSRKRYGCTAVVDEDGRLLGAFTDGDLRRCIAVHDLGDNIALHMSANPLAVRPETLVSEALQILTQHAVSVLFVEQDGKLAGIVHIHDLVRVGVA
jgi:arabinose-5-phosphate isomerase